MTIPFPRKKQEPNSLSGPRVISTAWLGSSTHFNFYLISKCSREYSSIVKCVVKPLFRYVLVFIMRQSPQHIWQVAIQISLTEMTYSTNSHSNFSVFWKTFQAIHTINQNILFHTFIEMHTHTHTHTHTRVYIYIYIYIDCLFHNCWSQPAAPAA